MLFSGAPHPAAANDTAPTTASKAIANLMHHLPFAKTSFDLRPIY
jgi:hypothetical protein